MSPRFKVSIKKVPKPQGSKIKLKEFKFPALKDVKIPFAKYPKIRFSKLKPIKIKLPKLKLE
ncbi:MAG: hypothetical protein ABIL76_06785 [candidate division WOR-3 bacterium]